MGGSKDTAPDSDGSQLELTALLEDYRAHWDELLRLEAEISRWITLYAAGAVLTIATAAGAAGADIMPDDVLFFERPRIFGCLIILACLNSGYGLSLAFKGYECQLLRFYMSTVIGTRIRELSHPSFNTYELWRRRTFGTRKGNNEAVRAAHYTVIGVLPFSVSLLLLFLASYYGFVNATAVTYAAYLFASLVTLTAAIASQHTIAVDRGWRSLAAAATPAEACDELPLTHPAEPSESQLAASEKESKEGHE